MSDFFILFIMKDFKKQYSIPATPDEIYLALTNPNTLLLWTGEPAEMTTEPGSEFSLWDGSIEGRNIEFVQDKMIKQQWYFDQEAESIVTITLTANKKGTSVELVHTNIPDDEYNDFVDGWNTSYFGALKEFYEE